MPAERTEIPHLETYVAGEFALNVEQVGHRARCLSVDQVGESVRGLNGCYGAGQAGERSAKCV